MEAPASGSAAAGEPGARECLGACKNLLVKLESSMLCLWRKRSRSHSGSPEQREKMDSRAWDGGRAALGMREGKQRGKTLADLLLQGFLSPRIPPFSRSSFGPHRDFSVCEGAGRGLGMLELGQEGTIPVGF